MLYSFSQAVYEQDELIKLLSSVTERDVVLLWQDGVLLAIKYPQYFSDCKGQCFALEQDISARNLTALFPKACKVRLISLIDLVEISEQFFPQMAL